MKSYRDAGVDMDKGDRFVDFIKAIRSPAIDPGIGGFSAAIDVASLGMRHPVLLTTTDGVGTKILVAQRLGKLDTVGIDLVAMCVNDLVVCGARPVQFLDYIACGRIQEDRLQALMKGIVRGCELAGCRLGGGETAEMPDVYGPDEFDLAGFAVGAVEKDGSCRAWPTSGPATSSSASPRRVSTPTACPWPARRCPRASGACCSSPPGSTRPRCPRCAPRATCWPRPTSPAAACTATSRTRWQRRPTAPRLAESAATSSRHRLVGHPLQRPVPARKALPRAPGACCSSPRESTRPRWPRCAPRATCWPPPTSRAAACTATSSGWCRAGLTITFSWDWPVPEVFRRIQESGGVSDAEMRAVFNLGIGIALVTHPDRVAALDAAARAAGFSLLRIGTLERG